MVPVEIHLRAALSPGVADGVGDAEADVGGDEVGGGVVAGGDEVGGGVVADAQATTRRLTRIVAGKRESEGRIPRSSGRYFL
jgi:hypothetical protein